jgi:DNA-binding PadR family transcriptional regulator
VSNNPPIIVDEHSKAVVNKDTFTQQIANSFILLMVLSNATEPSSTTQISEIISKKSRGEIFKLSSTLKDSLEYRLKRDGYVEGIDMKNKSLYSITPKGRKLLKGWIAFLSAYS